MKSIERDGDRLVLHSDYNDRHICGSLPNARWRPKAKAWSTLATPATWQRVKRAWPEEASDAVMGDEGCAELDLLARRREDPVDVDIEYDTEPWPHQKPAAEFASALDAVLLDCWMGAGKTKITFDTCATRGHEEVIVICPKSVIPVWRDEAEKHDPVGYDIILLKDGSVADRAKKLENAEPPYMVVANYEATWREPLGDLLLSKKWDAVVWDESHKIKSHKSKQAKFSAKLKAKHKIALSGTPMAHSPLDIFGQYKALDPGIFGTRWGAFRDTYAVTRPVGNHGKMVVGHKNLDQLKAKMDRLCYHVDKSALDLPVLTVQERYTDLCKDTRKIYNGLEQDFIAWLEDGEAVTASNALSKIIRLQQVAQGFTQPEEGKPRRISSEKAGVLSEILEEIPDERAAIFSSFHKDLDMVRETCDDLGRSFIEISGRENGYDDWGDLPDDGVAVCQAQAASHGIDLTEAAYVIFYSIGWSLDVYQQAISRVWRPGQTSHEVHVYRVCAENTIDERIIKSLDEKKDVIKSLMSL